MKKLFIGVVIFILILLILPMPHGGTLGGAFIESVIYEYQGDYIGGWKFWKRKANNYGEACKQNSDCFCNFDETKYEGCYYKVGQIDICKNNICTRGFPEK